jgi:hypothetical protein
MVSPIPTTNQGGTTGLHRSCDSIEGTFSYHIMQYKATSPIFAGVEIIMSDSEVGSGQLPSKDDYAEAGRLLKKVSDLVIEVNGGGSMIVQNQIIPLIRSGMESPAKELLLRSLHCCYYAHVLEELHP